MDSPRKIIRHAVGALLMGQTSVGNQVFINPVSELLAADLPALVVFNLKEELHEDALIGEQGRSLVLSVEAQAGDALPVADFIDDLSYECERLMRDSDNLGITSDYLRILDLKFDTWTLLHAVDGAVIEGAASTTFGIKYSWRIPDAEYSLDDFLKVRGTFETDGVDEPLEQFQADLPQT